MQELAIGRLQTRERGPGRGFVVEREARGESGPRETVRVYVLHWRGMGEYAFT